MDSGTNICSYSQIIIISQKAIESAFYSGTRRRTKTSKANYLIKQGLIMSINYFFVPFLVKDMNRGTTNKTSILKNRLTSTKKKLTATFSNANDLDEQNTIERSSSPDVTKTTRIKRAATLVLKGGRVSRDSSLLEFGSPRGNSPRNRMSNFFTEDERGIDVTTMLVRPIRDIEPLQLNSLSTTELVQVLKKKMNELNMYVLPMTTGKGEVNMMVSLKCCPSL